MSDFLSGLPVVSMLTGNRTSANQRLEASAETERPVKSQKKKNAGDEILTQGAPIAGSVLGSVAGGLIGSVVPGAGTLVGVAVGSSIGGALGGAAGAVVGQSAAGKDVKPPSPEALQGQIGGGIAGSLALGFIPVVGPIIGGSIGSSIGKSITDPQAVIDDQNDEQSSTLGKVLDLFT